MRVALIADTHGNRIALEAVFEHIDRQGVDVVVCLGDVAALGPEPSGCSSMIRERADICVLGNTDDWLNRVVPGAPPSVSDSETLNVMVEWAHGRLTREDIELLRELPLSARIELDAGNHLHVFHGSPRSYNEVIGANTLAKQLVGLLEGHDALIHAGGHTHVRMLRQIGKGMVINPGSVGLPGVGPGEPGLTVNEDVHWAEYATIARSRGVIRTAFHRIPVSVPKMLEAGRSSGMPGFEWWASKWRAMPEIDLTS